MPTLQSAAVSETDFEASISKLFNEWLGLYFDGGSHAIGNNAAVSFPAAQLLFQQAAIPQPLDGTAISMVWVHRSKPRLFWDVVNGFRQQLALLDMVWMFIIRAQLVETGSGNAKLFARTTSDRLFAILQNNLASFPLAQKGIHHLRPETPVLMSDGDGAKQGDPGYAMRALTCPGRVRYHILSQPTS